jgi:glycerol-3-phosphate acyltransferase PlsY
LIPWFVIYTHRSNISRLRNGNENQFKKAMIFRKFS